MIPLEEPPRLAPALAGVFLLLNVIDLLTTPYFWQRECSLTRYYQIQRALILKRHQVSFCRPSPCEQTTVLDAWS